MFDSILVDVEANMAIEMITQYTCDRCKQVEYAQATCRAFAGYGADNWVPSPMPKGWLRYSLLVFCPVCAERFRIFMAGG